jgi:heme-degrading monooxygenase HmoA
MAKMGCPGLTREMPMLARVITAQVTAEGIGHAIAAARKQLPDARDQPGFSGFCLLADREEGRVITISLWNSRRDAQAVESSAATIRGEAARSIGVTTPAVEIYEVAIRA